jgi:hypothetical protein
VGCHQLLHDWLEVGEDFDLGQRFRFDWIHFDP